MHHHSLTHSLTYSRTHSRTLSLSLSHTHTHTHSRTHSGLETFETEPFLPATETDVLGIVRVVLVPVGFVHGLGEFIGVASTVMRVSQTVRVP